METMNRKSTACKKMRYCTKCVYPASSAIPLAFDEKGLCSGCRTAEERKEIDWDRRKDTLVKILQDYKSRDQSNYDCIIPVSGGKDSYFQVHTIKNELGFHPLLVTYNSNNYTKTGMENLNNMRDVFGVDHVFFTASIHTLKKLNRLSVYLLGDTQWHYQAGIYTYPFQVSVKMNIPLLIWGEHGHMDLAGMHSYNDFIEFTVRFRTEHILRGFDWTDFLEQAAKYQETLTKQDMIPYIFPTDDEIDKVGTRGIFMANYIRWDANIHGLMVKEKYGFKESDEPFERTYRKMSNLDDMHENGIHDYLKFIKFGYGRATDHACKDIRTGIMTRKEAIEIVRKMDYIKPKDVFRWLDYVGWADDYFDRIADTFRDPRVWWIENGEWWKDNIWGEPSSYGKVHLSKEQQKKYIINS